MNSGIQKGNPYSLTRDQHIIPVKSLLRFSDTNGKVNLYDMNGVFLRLTSPSTDKVFMSGRAWNQRAESGFGKNIEDKFQSVVDNLLLPDDIESVKLDHEVVSRMFLLIRARLHYVLNPVADQPVKGMGVTFNVGGEVKELSQDNYEILEKRHVSAIQPNGCFSGRDIIGSLIQRDIDYSFSGQFVNAIWVVIKAESREFIFSDSYGLPILPLSPKYCLVADIDFQDAGSDEIVDWINERGRLGCKRFCITKP